MKALKSILVALYTFWVLTVFTVFMLIFIPFILIPFLLGQRYGSISYTFLWLWSWIFSKLTFIRYELINKENFSKGRAYIYVSNHTSFLDAPGIRLMIPTQFRPLAKKELLKIPVFGLIVRSACIIVDRGDSASRKKSLGELIKLINGGISPLIFAEGTQNRTDQLLQPFKDGAFRIAIDTQTNIAPMVVIGAGRLMYPGQLKVLPGKIKVVAGEPIDVKKFGDDVAALRQHTFDTMLNLIKTNQ
jgi:1-acyl-sn-glycerol-3-phosphate acyltransferase